MSEKIKGQQEERREAVKAIAPVQVSAQEPQKTEPEKEISRLVVYVGPSLKGAMRGTIYNNGFPDVLKDAIKEKPAIRELLVPISDLPAANKELMNPDSARSRIFGIVDKYFRKGE